MERKGPFLATGTDASAVGYNAPRHLDPAETAEKAAFCGVTAAMFKGVLEGFLN